VPEVAVPELPEPPVLAPEFDPAALPLADPETAPEAEPEAGAVEPETPPEP